MAHATPAIAGYTHIDEKGRLTLAKPIRQALQLKAGSALAWLKLGDAILLIPADAQLAQLMETAAAVFEHEHLSLEILEEELTTIREEVTAAHYGPQWLQELAHSADAPSHP